jgi:hypothetical protein
MIRPDAYAYIHLSGIPYCNAARQCQAICERTHLFSSDHTCVRLYRIAAQLFVVTLTVLLSYAILQARTNYASTIIVALIVLFSYLSATHFVDIHSNAAEGLVTCYLAENNCDGANMQVCPNNLRNEIYNFEVENNLIEE